MGTSGEEYRTIEHFTWSPNPLMGGSCDWMSWDAGATPQPDGHRIEIRHANGAGQRAVDEVGPTRVLGTPENTHGYLPLLTVSPDGRVLAIQSRDDSGVVRIVRTNDGSKTETTLAPRVSSSGSVPILAFSTDSTKLAAAALVSDRYALLLFDMASLVELSARDGRPSPSEPADNLELDASFLTRWTTDDIEVRIVPRIHYVDSSGRRRDETYEVTFSPTDFSAAPRS